jgi:hypothetical protein
MTSLVAKYISKRILGESVKNNFGSDDPYFEQVPATRLDGRPSTKTKKRRKALPAGLSEHDGKVLTKVKRRAYRLDMSLFNFCGIRFGWSSVIGIVPGIGDVLDAFMAIMVLRTCQQVEGGLPKDVQSKMYFNIMLDFVVGLVPFLGDIADAVFRANTRNAVELEKFLRKKGAAALKAQGNHTPAIDPSDPDEYDRLMREEHGPPPGYTTSTPARQGTQRGTGNGSSPTYPEPARVPEERQGGGGWFGFGGKKKQHDVEHGEPRRNEVLQTPADQPTRNKSTLQKNRPAR